MQRFPNPGLFKKASVRETICSLPGRSLLREEHRTFSIEMFADYCTGIHIATGEGHPYGRNNCPPPNAADSVVLFIYAKPQSLPR